MVRRAPETPGTVPSIAGTLTLVFPAVRNVPAISTGQMIEVDRVMIEDLGIDLVRMMENAGRSLAALAIALHAPRTVQVLAGSGGNGGGVSTAARHLWNRGVDVRVTNTADPDRMTPVAAKQAHILDRIGVEFSSRPKDADLVLDGLIGYSLSGAPRGRALELIEWSHGRTVLSLDVPSGVDSETGSTPGAAIRATSTLTLALPKTGIVGHEHTGRLFLADISVPPQVYRAFGIDLETPFGESPIVEIV
jgi:NAD(P)H-hydrate epimerase